MGIHPSNWFAPLSAAVARFCLATQLRSIPAVSTSTVGSFYAKASGLPVCLSNTLAFFLKGGQLCSM